MHSHYGFKQKISKIILNLLKTPSKLRIKKHPEIYINAAMLLIFLNVICSSTQLKGMQVYAFN